MSEYLSNVCFVNGREALPLNFSQNAVHVSLKYCGLRKHKLRDAFVKMVYAFVIRELAAELPSFLKYRLH